ncbi:MAG: site-specific integrase [Chloroflexota bacterium]|nr:site-specific integrase [Chloroflexota bacterium]
MTASNYHRSIQKFVDWCERELERQAVVADVEPGTVGRFLHARKAVSAESARTAWVALRSLAKSLAEMGIHHDAGESVLRRLRQPKVKEERRRNLSDAEMYRVMERAAQGETAERDRAIVMTLLGTGLRRGELIGLRLGDVDIAERQLRVRASTSKSVRPRDVAIPLETLKELDRYIRDFRRGDSDEDAPLFTGRRGGPLTAQAVKRLFDRLKVRTGIRDLCAHMLRHTWATNYNRSGSGSSFDLQVEGGWTTPRMVDRYCKVRPLAERRRAPSPFTAPRAAIVHAEKRPAEMRPPQQRSVPALRRVR